MSPPIRCTDLQDQAVRSPNMHSFKLLSCLTLSCLAFPHRISGHDALERAPRSPRIRAQEVEEAIDHHGRASVAQLQHGVLRRRDFDWLHLKTSTRKRTT
jgi:hypothetical protein